MIERGVGPGRRVVALLAGLREAGLHVIRIHSAVEVLDVARRAIGGRAGKLSIHVTLVAGNTDVRSGQRKLRKRTVIEGRRVPRCGAMTLLAGLGEAGLDVRRIVGLIEVRQVTAHAGGGRAGVLSAHVAGRAV